MTFRGELRGSVCAAVVALLLSFGSLRGQDLPAQAEAASLGMAALAAAAPASGDKPAPRTARLTFFAGAVQVKRADNSAEDAPILNLPLPEGTVLITGDYGQAEIEFEDGSVARMTPRSSLSIVTLSVDSTSVAHTRLNLLDGLAYFELRKAAGSLYEVDAAGTQASPIENLTLRINFDHPPAVFAVLSGAAQVSHGEDFKTQLRAGETLQTDAKDETRYFLSAQVPDESWDQWNQQRDQAATDQADTRTTARDSYAGGQGYGWSDLDANGTWYDIPGQGEVWQPTAAAGAEFDDFDPYDSGTWVWSGQGYVWASAYSWGWTPFRCGYWAFYPSFGWGWFPNAGCSRWGYAGFGGGETLIYVGEERQPHRRPIPRPIPPPGRPHPILPVRPPVRPPVGVHPPRPIGGPVKILAWTAQPLKPIGGTSLRSGSVLGATALNRDFPLDPRTRQPVFGTLPGTSPVLRPPMTGVAQPPAFSGDQSRPSRNRPDRNAGGDAQPGNQRRVPFPTNGMTPRPAPVSGGSPPQLAPIQTDRGQPPPSRPVQSRPEPTRIDPGRADPPRMAPIQSPPSQPAPVRSTPPPAASRPSSPPPAPAPARTPPPDAPAKPKS